MKVEKTNQERKRGIVLILNLYKSRFNRPEERYKGLGKEITGSFSRSGMA
jgi:hypothetical protein